MSGTAHSLDDNTVVAAVALTDHYCAQGQGWRLRIKILFVLYR